MTSVNINTGAIVAARNIEKFGKEMDISIERLSSGLRINSAKDDAAVMAIVSNVPLRDPVFDRLNGLYDTWQHDSLVSFQGKAWVFAIDCPPKYLQLVGQEF